MIAAAPVDPAAALPDARRSRDLFGHPRGLAYIVFTEAWERFSFYGMQALLVLYLSGYLFRPGRIDGVWGIDTFRSAVEGVVGALTPQAFAAQTFGLYAGFVYLTPVIGGWLGDRVIGRTRAVTLGAGVMVAGHLAMAAEAALLPALAALLVGCGLLKGNLAAQVGALYARDDPRRDRAFSIYYVGVNLGAFVAPLVCGTLGELMGWHYGFAVAGLGMAIGLAVYLSGRRHLPADPSMVPGERPHLARGDARIVATLLLLLALFALFWIVQTQVWNSYPIWVRDRLDRDVLGWLVPVTWFQSLDSLTVLALAPPLLWWWRRRDALGLRDTDLGRIGFGCAVFAGACLWLVLGERVAGEGRVAILWPVLFHLTCAIGYLHVVPIGLALFARAAPPSVNALMVSVYYLGIFIGSIASGWLGRFYETMPGEAFWAMHAAIAAAAGVIILALRRAFARALGLSHTGA